MGAQIVILVVGRVGVVVAQRRVLLIGRSCNQASDGGQLFEQTDVDERCSGAQDRFDHVSVRQEKTDHLRYGRTVLGTECGEHNVAQAQCGKEDLLIALVDGRHE